MVGTSQVRAESGRVSFPVALLQQQAQVFPLQSVLRGGWNTNNYMRGLDHDRPFLVEDGSKAHLSRIAALMKSNSTWSYIGLICCISRESELIGSWCEGCPCHNLEIEHFDFESVVASALVGETETTTVEDGVTTVEIDPPRCRPRPRKARKSFEQKEAAACTLKCCRAPELAIGHAQSLQCQFMKLQGPLFNKLVSSADAKDRGLLSATWTATRSKLYGSSSK